MIPRFGEPVQVKRQYMLRPGAYVILPLHGKVLLTVQIADTYDVQLPGGGIDQGESPRQALYREVLEETGWSIVSPIRLGAFRRFVFMPEYDLWAEKLCHVYVARPTRKIAETIEADHETLWLPPNDAIQVLSNDGDKSMLARYFALSGPV